MAVNKTIGKIEVHLFCLSSVTRGTYPKAASSSLRYDNKANPVPAIPS